MLGLRIKNVLTTDSKWKLRDFRSAYTFNTQDNVAAMLFVIVKMVWPETRSGCSDIKYKLENKEMSQFKHDNPKAKLHISEWMNGISIDAETY